MKKVQPIQKSDFYLSTVHPEMFDSLSEEDRENNPEFVLYTAAYRSRGGTDCSYLATESLKNYCMAERESLCKDSTYKEGAVAIFGDQIWNTEPTSEHLLV